MPVNLVIIGGGDFYLELLSWADDVQKNWEFKGFLDDDIKFSNNEFYLGSIKNYKIQENDRFICAIGSAPRAKLTLSRDIESRGGQFINIIHPTAIVSSQARYGKGCIFAPYTFISCFVTIGDHVLLNVSSTVGHNASIGSGCTLSGHADVTGHAELEEGVFLGSHASILPGKKVGAYAKVGAGSIVIRNVTNETTVFGVPAKRISA